MAPESFYVEGKTLIFTLKDSKIYIVRTKVVALLKL